MRLPRHHPAWWRLKHVFRWLRNLKQTPASLVNVPLGPGEVDPTNNIYSWWLFSHPFHKNMRTVKIGSNFPAVSRKFKKKIQKHHPGKALFLGGSRGSCSWKEIPFITMRSEGPQSNSHQLDDKCNVPAVVGGTRLVFLTNNSVFCQNTLCFLGFVKNTTVE